jgi:prevent-host-death family protein
MTVISSREFNQNRSTAIRATRDGPVIITDRGKPAYVLMTIEEYEANVKVKRRSIIEALSMPGGEDIDFEFPRLDDIGIKPVDFD